jgi:hypothetical protein
MDTTTKLVLAITILIFGILCMCCAWTSCTCSILAIGSKRLKNSNIKLSTALRACTSSSSSCSKSPGTGGGGTSTSGTGGGGTNTSGTGGGGTSTSGKAMTNTQVINPSLQQQQQPPPTLTSIPATGTSSSSSGNGTSNNNNNNNNNSGGRTTTFDNVAIINTPPANPDTRGPLQYQVDLRNQLDRSNITSTDMRRVSAWNTWQFDLNDRWKIEAPKSERDISKSMSESNATFKGIPQVSSILNEPAPVL